MGNSPELISLFCEKSAMKEEKVLHIKPKALAYIGDAVFELLIRKEKLFQFSSDMWHSASVKIVSDLSKNKQINYSSAPFQAKIFLQLSQILNEKELTLLKKWKNEKNPKKKHITRQTYAKSTAFEALIGYLFLSGKHDKLKSVLMLVFGENQYNETK